MASTVVDVACSSLTFRCCWMSAICSYTRKSIFFFFKNNGFLTYLSIASCKNILRKAINCRLISYPVLSFDSTLLCQNRLAWLAPSLHSHDIQVSARQWAYKLILPVVTLLLSVRSENSCVYTNMVLISPLTRCQESSEQLWPEPFKGLNRAHWQLWLPLMPEACLECSIHCAHASWQNVNKNPAKKQKHLYD